MAFVEFRDQNCRAFFRRAFQNLTFFSYLDLSWNHLTSDALNEEVFYGRYHGNQGQYLLKISTQTHLDP